jgi:hypothetical protein
MNDPLTMLKTVAEGLGSLREELVFTGGATVSLYVRDKAARRFRNTDDVDCVVGISSRKQYRDLEKKLQLLGFSYCIEDNSPICRWIYKGIKVDVMPSGGKAFGFTNLWYESGMNNTEKVSISDTFPLLTIFQSYGNQNSCQQ